MTQTRTIMCFGDSNTYGAIPTLARIGRHRFAPDRRWPGIMRRQLGNGWEVLEEGHPGRTTTVHDDPIEGLHNGLKALPVCLETHMPLDLVILMLGTNDLKHRFSVTAADVADSIEVLVRGVHRSEAGHGGAAPAVLVVAPPPCWRSTGSATCSGRCCEVVRIWHPHARRGQARGRRVLQRCRRRRFELRGRDPSRRRRASRARQGTGPAIGPRWSARADGGAHHAAFLGLITSTGKSF